MILLCGMEFMKGSVVNFIAEPVKDEYWVQILSLIKFYQWLTRKSNKSTHYQRLSQQSGNTYGVRLDFRTFDVKLPPWLANLT